MSDILQLTCQLINMGFSYLVKYLLMHEICCYMTSLILVKCRKTPHSILLLMYVLIVIFMYGMFIHSICIVGTVSHIVISCT